MKNLSCGHGYWSYGATSCRIYSEFTNLIGVVDMNEKVGSSIARKFSTDCFQITVAFWIRWMQLLQFH